MTGFDIHALSVGPGMLALSPLPGLGGAYPDDLARIRAWRPALVVSLCERSELQGEGAGALTADLVAGGIAWRRFPVADYGVPGPEAAAEWEAISQAARAILMEGGKVLVHCKGGCGRSGMAVLRIMIDSGEDGVQALARLRRARPCAVETEAQRDWAFGGAAPGGRVGFNPPCRSPAPQSGRPSDRLALARALPPL